MEGGARGEVVRATSAEISNATAATSSFVSTGMIARLRAGVKIAEPAVAQNGQTCDTNPVAFVSTHRWNWPARNRIASKKTSNSRTRFPLMCILRRSLGKKGWQVKHFASTRFAIVNFLALSVEVGPFAGFDEACPVKGVLSIFAFHHGQLGLTQRFSASEAAF